MQGFPSLMQCESIQCDSFSVVGDVSGGTWVRAQQPKQSSSVAAMCVAHHFCR